MPISTVETPLAPRTGPRSLCTAKVGAVWDAVHLAAGELVLSVELRGNRPDGNSLHANTAANALHHAFRSSSVPQTRLLLVLLVLLAARRLLPTKSSGDPHDIKFPVAIFEDLDLVSPAWRPHLLAAAVFSFWGSDRPDNSGMEQVREAIRRL